MNKLSAFIISTLLITTISAQEDTDYIYRRNSLCSFFLSESKTDVHATSDFIVDAIETYKFPDKFNDHNVGSTNILDLTKMPVIGSYRDIAIKRNKVGLGKALGIVFFSNDDDYYRYDLPARIMFYINESKLANQLIAKWFNASRNKINGSFYNMELIQERGAYNASELDKLKAKESIRGHAILEDAGMELIPNTYVTFTVFEFYSLSKMLDDLNKNQNQETNPILGIFQTAKQVKAIANSFAGKSGYYVTARTYLFKLKWDKEEEDLFINEYWNASVDKLLSSDYFHLNYMGFQKSSVWYTTKTESSFDAKANAPLVSQATNRAIDECLAKLMDDFEDFRVKAPIIEIKETPSTLIKKRTPINDNMYLTPSINNDNNKKRDKEISAFIGIKEGVNKKSEFEVLEKSFDPSKNVFRYKRVGILKVDKNRIWDNRFTIKGIETRGEQDVDYNPSVDRTYFIGKSEKFAPGMLIRQIK